MCSFGCGIGLEAHFAEAKGVLASGAGVENQRRAIQRRVEDGFPWIGVPANRHLLFNGWNDHPFNNCSNNICCCFLLILGVWGVDFAFTPWAVKCPAFLQAQNACRESHAQSTHQAVTSNPAEQYPGQGKNPPRAEAE